MIIKRSAGIFSAVLFESCLVSDQEQYFALFAAFKMQPFIANGYRLIAAMLYLFVHESTKFFPLLLTDILRCLPRQGIGD